MNNNNKKHLYKYTVQKAEAYSQLLYFSRLPLPVFVAVLWLTISLHLSRSTFFFSRSIVR